MVLVVPEREKKLKTDQSDQYFHYLPVPNTLYKADLLVVFDVVVVDHVEESRPSNTHLIDINH